MKKVQAMRYSEFLWVLAPVSYYDQAHLDTESTRNERSWIPIPYPCHYIKPNGTLACLLSLVGGALNPIHDVCIGCAVSASLLSLTVGSTV